MKTICKQLGIDLPIIQGGMGNISNSELTAAVSEAGGLGTIGCGTMNPEEVEKIILKTKQKTSRPFAVNIAITVNPYTEDMIQLVLKHQVPVVSLSAGNPEPYISILHQHGIKVIVVVASVKHAQKAEAAGADILVAEGYEAAGINSSLELTTFTLIPQITSSVKIPVVAAGGIGDGKGLAAVFMLGASGVQMGTRLIATREAPFHELYKENLLKSKGTDTVIVGRSVGRVRRVLNTPYAQMLLDAEKNGMDLNQFNELTAESFHLKGALFGDFENGYVNSGQITGLISDIPNVKELFEEMMLEAEEQVTNLSKIFTQFHFMRK